MIITLRHDNDYYVTRDYPIMLKLVRMSASETNGGRRRLDDRDVEQPPTLDPRNAKSHLLYA